MKKNILIAIIVLICSYIIFYCTRNVITSLLSAALALGMALVTLSDIKAFRIPDAISLPFIPLGVLTSAYLSPHSLIEETLFETSLAAVVGFCFLYLLKISYRYLRDRDGLGMGDVKLLAVAGAWTGLAGLNAVILIAACSALLVLLILHMSGRAIKKTTAIPFGAFLAPAIWLTWSLQQIGLIERTLL